LPWGAREGAGPGSRGPQQHWVGSPCLPRADQPDSEDRHVCVSRKNFGVSVSVTPVVLSHGRISRNISAEVSELTSDGSVSLNDIAIPALKVRRAKTTLELPSGGTLAITSIPILGALLRSNDYWRKESELIILVTR
jgi:pilus assembly protein CpaC